MGISNITSLWDDSGEHPNKNYPWHAVTCPIIRTHRFDDCDCGGHQRELDYQREQNAKKL